MKDSRLAFTLIEVMIVIMIIGLLAAISYPSYARSRANAQRSVCQNNLRTIAGEADIYLFEHTEENFTLQDLAPSMKNGVIPECPSGGTYTLQPGSDPIVVCSHGDGHDL